MEKQHSYTLWWWEWKLSGEQKDSIYLKGPPFLLLYLFAVSKILEWMLFYNQKNKVLFLSNIKSSTAHTLLFVLEKPTKHYFPRFVYLFSKYLLSIYLSTFYEQVAVLKIISFCQLHFLTDKSRIQVSIFKSSSWTWAGISSPKCS